MNISMRSFFIITLGSIFFVLSGIGFIALQKNSDFVSKITKDIIIIDKEKSKSILNQNIWLNQKQLRKRKILDMRIEHTQNSYKKIFEMIPLSSDFKAIKSYLYQDKLILATIAEVYFENTQNKKSIFSDFLTLTRSVVRISPHLKIHILKENQFVIQNTKYPNTFFIFTEIQGKIIAFQSLKNNTAVIMKFIQDFD
jgi:hypothetical protein